MSAPAIEPVIEELARRLPGFALASVELGPHDRRARGQLAARRALRELGEDPEALAYDGPRPIVRDGRAAISITHDRSHAVAVAARVSRLGIDLCRNDSRLPALAARFLVAEQAIATRFGDLAACFAAKEAALKALGVGLVDGGVLDGTAVTVVSLDPPRLSDGALALAIARGPLGALAVVYTSPR